MTGFYVLLGLIVLVTHYFDPMVSGTSKTILGIILIAYGLSRVYFFYKKQKEKK